MPEDSSTAFIAPTAVIIGDVTIEERPPSGTTPCSARLSIRSSYVAAQRAGLRVVHVTPRAGTEIGAGSTVATTARSTPRRRRGMLDRQTARRYSTGRASVPERWWRRARS